MLRGGGSRHTASASSGEAPAGAKRSEPPFPKTEVSYRRPLPGMQFSTISVVLRERLCAQAWNAHFCPLREKRFEDQGPPGHLGRAALLAMGTLF